MFRYSAVRQSAARFEQKQYRAALAAAATAAGESESAGAVAAAAALGAVVMVQRGDTVRPPSAGPAAGGGRRGGVLEFGAGGAKERTRRDSFVEATNPMRALLKPRVAMAARVASSGSAGAATDRGGGGGGGGDRLQELQAALRRGSRRNPVFRGASAAKDEDTPVPMTAIKDF